MQVDALLLILVATAAFVVEASLGFGATVVAVSLGALVLPIAELLPAFVPLNLVLSAILVARGPRHVDLALLGKRVLPVMALGLPLGMWAFRALPGDALAACFGGFVVALSALELARRGAPKPLSTSAGAALLLLGGAVHGAFGTGGPMAVYVVGRTLDDDKARFRATLSALWLVLNAVLVAGYLVDGRIGEASLRRTATLAVGLLIGMVVGEALHRRLPVAAFRVVVYALLLVAGLLLILRA